MEYDDGSCIVSSPRREFSSERNLRSFTIKSLLAIDIETKPYKIDNAEISQISIIGWVKLTKKTKSGKFFVVDDKTGTIGCNFWPRNPYEEEMEGLVEEKNLINVIGSLRVSEGKPSVTVNFLKVINDCNQLTFHFLKCIHQHLFYNNKLKRPDNLSKRKLSQNVNDSRIDNDGVSGCTAIQFDILDEFKKNQSDTGLHVDIVVRSLSKKYKEEEIRENIEILLQGGGHLYSVEGLEYKTIR